MEFKGKTLEEALENAEASTGRTRNELIYKIIDKKAGFFKGKECYIKVEGVKEKSKIRIKDGQIFFTRGEINPYIEPGDDVSIMVNGRAINAKTLVRETDAIEINPIETELKREIKINIAEDNMSAAIEVMLNSEKSYEICDYDEQDYILVQAKLVKEVKPDPFSQSEVEKVLKENKISYGIKWEKLKNILNGGSCIIAEGLVPEEPINDEIEYLFDAKKESKPLESDGKVDYYNIEETEFVEAGKVLALKKEGKDGKPGYDIFNNIIKPEKRKIEKILAGSGCEAIDNGNRVIATIKGMPSLKGERVYVFPSHIINGDVDLKTGNINFEGDIVVKGSVKEGLSIHCGNNLTVFGEVAEASLSSVGNVVLHKNLISSIVTAGENQLQYTKAVEYIKSINKLFTNLIEVHHELKKSSKLPGNIKDSQILKILLESKFQSLKKELIEASNLININKTDEKIYDIYMKSFEIFKLIDNGLLNNLDTIEKQKNRNNDFISNYEILVYPADITLGYSQNSQISATNDLIVKGKGCYNTNISVQNKAVFTGTPGIFRGGQIYAKNAIMLKEAGSPAGVLTLLRTSREGVIEVNLAYQNTVINIDNQVYRIDNPVKMLKAYMQKGEIIVEKLKA